MGRAVDHRLAGDALLGGLVGIDVPGLVDRLDLARGVGPAEQPRPGIDEVDPRAIGAQEAGRLVDRELQHARKVGRRGDPGVDLAQRSLNLGSLGELRSRAVEVLDQAGVGHRGGGMIGQRADEGDLRLVERLRAGGERAHRPEHLVAGGERRDDHRADADVLDDAVGLGGMAERGVVLVVVRDHDGPLDQRSPEHAGAGRELQAADPFAAALAPDTGVVREAQVPGGRVDQVDHCAVSVEEPGGLFDGHRQQLVDPARATVGVGRGRVGLDRTRRSGWGGHRREDTTGPPRAGIAVRPRRLRHPAEARVDPRRRRSAGECPGRLVSLVGRVRPVPARTISARHGTPDRSPT